jgi:ABC transport permease subunit
MIRPIFEYLSGLGRMLFFLRDAAGCVLKGKIRWAEVLKEVYQQGVESVLIIAAASFATGAVLALQGYAMLARFGAKEYVAHLVALSLVRELSPVFGSFIFSGKAGARMAAELSTMSVNDQIVATRAMGVDPVEYLVVPRMVACLFVLPGLIVMSEFFGILGGYAVSVFDAAIPGPRIFSRPCGRSIMWIFSADLSRRSFLLFLFPGYAVIRDFLPKGDRWVWGGSRRGRWRFRISPLLSPTRS